MSTDDETAAPAANTDSTTSAPVPEAPRPARGKLARGWDWFWRGQAMRAVMAPMPKQRQVLRLRAHLAADVARRTEESAEPFEGRVDALLCDLYRQSIYWSRAALSSATGTAAPQPFADSDGSLLQPDAELRARAERMTQSATFQELASLPEEERQTFVAPLRALALTLLAELEFNKRAVEALWTQRLLRLGLLGALVLVVAFAGLQLSQAAEKARDLAIGRPWHVSSMLSSVTPCQSPEQECVQSPEFFFHTNEEQQPWIVFDLGRAQQFSAVRVENRTDCCSDRAIPLLIEVSSDNEHWRLVARRETSFSSWLAKFEPVSARYVRVRIDRRESLHLRRVRVLR